MQRKFRPAGHIIVTMFICELKPVFSGSRVHDRIDEFVSCPFFGNARGFQTNMPSKDFLFYIASMSNMVVMGTEALSGQELLVVVAN
jgi:hypothetical protein